MQPSPVTKRNPRPRKYASAADRQAAYRARNEMLEFRAEAATAKTINDIANTLDTSRSVLLLSMVKFALTNHDWARFGLTHKTIPFYQGNPIMDVRKMSAIQLSKALDKASEAQSKIIHAMIEGGRGRETPKETMTKNDPLSLKYQTSANHLADLYFEKNRRMTWHGSMKPIKYQENPTMATTKKPSPAQLAARAKFANMARTGGFAKKKARTANKMISRVPKLNPAKTNPTDVYIEKYHLGGKMYAQIIQKSDNTFDLYVYQMQQTGVKGEAPYEQFFYSKNYKTNAGAMRGLHKYAADHKYDFKMKMNPAKTNPAKKSKPYCYLCILSGGDRYGLDERTAVSMAFSPTLMRHAYKCYAIPPKVEKNPAFQDYAGSQQMFYMSLAEMRKQLQKFN